MTLTLSALDLGLVAIFIAAILGLGFSARLREMTAFQLLTAGRSLTLPAFVVTLVCTWYGGILGVAESTSFYGYGAWLMIGVPYYVFGVVYALVLAPKVRAAEQISLPERLERAFDRRMGLTGASLLLLLAIPAAHALMLGVLLEAVTGWPKLLTIPLATLVGSLFLYKGGLLADVRASALAFLMMYVGFGVMLWACFRQSPPWEAWPRDLPANLRDATGGQGPLAVLTFFILGMWTLIDPAFHQRVASTATPEVGRKGVLTAVGFWVLFDLLTISISLYALAWLKNPPSDPLLLFPAFGQQMLPEGLRAVFLCGMVGTILSAMVGYLLVSGGTIGREIVSRIRPDADETRWSRVGIALATVTAILIALSINSVVTLWYSWSGAVIGALVLPVLLAYGVFPRWQPASGTVFVTTLLAALVSGGLLIYGLVTANPYLMVTLPAALGGGQVGVGTLLPGLVVSVLGLSFGPRSRHNTQHGRTAPA